MYYVYVCQHVMWKVGKLFWHPFDFHSIENPSKFNNFTNYFIYFDGDWCDVNDLIIVSVLLFHRCKFIRWKII